MKDSKFWKPKKDTQESKISSSKDITNLKDPNMGGPVEVKFMKPKGVKNKKFLQRIGLTGGILIALGGIAAFFLYVYVVRPAYALMSTINALKADTSDIGTALKNRDLVQLDKDLTRLEADLGNVKAERERSFGWAKNVKVLKISEFYADSDRFINAGYYSIDALRETAAVVTPFADAAGLKISEDQEIIETEGLMEAFQDWVSIMPDVAAQMDGVIEKISKVGEELEPINVDKYPKSFRGVIIRDNIAFVKNTLSKADDYAPDIKEALTLFPRVLGVGTSTKRYMIIMQNDKELRPTGGFMTNYATFKIQNGLLQSDFTSKDMYSIDYALDLIDATYDFPDAPEAYMRYLKVERWYARDMNSSPDFITSMDQFMKFYNMASSLTPYDIKAVDGVFAINTNVIKELLEATGSVTVNGITYTPENVVIELEKIASLQLQEQINRKKVLGDLMEAMLINVFESDKNLWPKMIEKGVDLAARKHVLVYLFDPEAQALVEKYNLAGRIKDPVEGDYSMVVSTNLGGDKTNWFTSKVVTHKLEKVDSKWVRTVNIKYTYTEPQGDYSLFAKRFKDWVRVYMPVGSEIISIEGSEDGTMSGEEMNKAWHSAYVEMGPGESKEVTFKYYLPQTLNFDSGYKLTLQKQSGIDSEKHIFDIAGKKKEEINLKTDRDITVSL